MDPIQTSRPKLSVQPPRNGIPIHGLLPPNSVGLDERGDLQICLRADFRLSYFGQTMKLCLTLFALAAALIWSGASTLHAQTGRETRNAHSATSEAINRAIQNDPKFAQVLE